MAEKKIDEEPLVGANVIDVGETIWEAGGTREASEAVKLSTAEDLLKDYRTAYYQLLGGFYIEFQAVPAEDFEFIGNNPVADAFVAAGIDPTDDNAREQLISKLSDNQMLDLSFNRRSLNQMMRVVAKAVTSVQFSELRQADCPLGAVSLWNISDADVVLLFDAIRKFSVGEDNAKVRGTEGKSGE